ncbi:diguanylate cyclase [Terasakiella pusilla]|uniref:sensor domain-containing diguanylate cyclase n=1 Tax=Terasakiella pusilla TaxID=64973 RepID=UPI003AA8D959
MKSLSFKISHLNDLETLLETHNVRDLSRQASSVFIQIFSAFTQEERYISLSTYLREQVPDAVVVGASTVGEISQGESLTETTVISFSFFSSTIVKAIATPCTIGKEKEAGQSFIDSILDSGKDIVGLLVLATPLSMDTSLFFQGFDHAQLPFPVFGGGAGDYAMIEKSVVLHNDQVLNAGAVGVVFCSQTLEINIGHYLGWRALSKKMTITEVDGLSIKTIDHQPAADVYKRYLDIKDNDSFFLNVLEFPLLIERNGRQIARVPVGPTPEQGLMFIADIQEGESFRIGYGDPSLIINDAQSLHEKTAHDQPEAIFLYTCGCRRFLLQEETNLETQPFEAIAPTAGFYTYGEFSSINGTVETLNSAMLCITMIEGAKPDSSTQPPISAVPPKKSADPYAYQHSRIISRLVHFIDQVTTELEEANQNIQHLSLMDQLTGLYNRRKLDQVLSEQIDLASRYDTPFSVLLLDVDFFKKVNDTYGHLMGDQLLQDLSHILTKKIRSVDILGRWGGEEFLIILPNCQLAGAMQLAEKIRLAIAETSFQTVGAKTVSIGVGCYRKGDQVEQLLQRADHALYQAKKSGRNCVKTETG